MSTLGLTSRQVQFELRTFRRNVTGMLFTFMFPIILLVLIASGSPTSATETEAGTVPFIQFFAPGIIVYGLIGACYNNLAMRVSLLRESGVLKRVSGTPLPRALYLAGQICASVVIGLILAAITLIASVIFYHLHIPTHTLLALIVTIIIGGASFCAIGLCVASLVPNADAAPGVVNLTMFPILFISDIFYSVTGGPHWLITVGNIFPVKHFANAMQVIFSPHTKGLGFSAHHLLIIAVWGAAAAVYASRHFRWENKAV